MKKMPLVLAIFLGSFLFTNRAAAQAPNYGWPGCPHIVYCSPLVVIVEYYACWNCPLQPFSLGCNGDCANPCITATDRTFKTGDTWEIRVYNEDGGINTTFDSNSWTEEEIMIGEYPGTRLTFFVTQ